MKYWIHSITLSLCLNIPLSYTQPFWEKIADFEAYSFTFNSSDHIFVGTDSANVYRSTDNGNTFELLSIRPPASGWQTDQLGINSQGVLFANVAPRDLHRSNDNGDTWTSIHATDFARDLLIDENDNLYIPQSSGNILFSTDNGDSWSELPLPSVHGLTINSQGILFAGTWNQGIFKSTDGGNNWENALFKGNITCWKLAVSPDQKIHALYNSYYASEDGGITWENRHPQFGLIGPMTTHGNDVYVGFLGSDKIYRSTNAGINWTQLDTSGLNGATFDNSTENQIALDAQGYIYAYCRVFGNPVLTGVYRSTQPVSGIEKEPDNLPTEFFLYQNYPNPFNPSTTIKFSIPLRSSVTIKIFDLLGVEIKTLIKDELDQGTYNVEFNANNLTSGIYFYVLIAGNFRETKKMLLLK